MSGSSSNIQVGQIATAQQMQDFNSRMLAVESHVSKVHFQEIVSAWNPHGVAWSHISFIGKDFTSQPDSIQLLDAPIHGLMAKIEFAVGRDLFSPLSITPYKQTYQTGPSASIYNNIGGQFAGPVIHQGKDYSQLKLSSTVAGITPGTSDTPYGILFVDLKSSGVALDQVLFSVVSGSTKRIFSLYKAVSDGLLYLKFYPDSDAPTDWETNVRYPSALWGLITICPKAVGSEFNAYQSNGRKFEEQCEVVSGQVWACPVGYQLNTLGNVYYVETAAIVKVPVPKSLITENDPANGQFTFDGSITIPGGAAVYADFSPYVMS